MKKVNHTNPDGSTVEECGKKTGAVTDLELVAVEYPLKRKVVK